MSEARIRRVCAHCGSTALVWDACAVWDEARQDFLLEGLYDSKPTCNDCGREDWDQHKELVCEP